MSVNEVKHRKTTKAFQVRGTTGPKTSRTFAIGNEDHTLGNALRHVLIQNAKVDFAGYSVPHPSEPVVHIRVQTRKDAEDDDPVAISASEALQEACDTLYKQCDIVLEALEEKLPEVKEDKLSLAVKLEEFQGDDDEEEDEGLGDDKNTGDEMEE